LRRERAAGYPADPASGDSADRSRVLAVRRGVLARRDRLLPVHAQGRLRGEQGRMTLRGLAALVIALAAAARASPASGPKPAPPEAALTPADLKVDAAADLKRDELIQ